MTTLQAQPREASADLAALRKVGQVPAVIYGKGVDGNILVSVDRESFKKAWAAAGSSTAVTITGAGHDHDVIIHDFQIDPTTDIVIHIDFLALDKNTKVTVQVELEFTGEAPAVKAGLGILEKALHEIEVEALPKDLPKSIIVDISGMEDADAQIHIKDLAIPTGVEVKGHDGDDVVALISAIKEEAEEAAGPIDFSAIEVEKKGKKEDEEAAE
jgi:large subunit ribosomal protein L25